MAERISTTVIKKDMYCPKCRAWHTRAIPEELGIVIGDSQASNLHVGQDRKKVDDQHHFDYYILPGCKLDELCAGLAYFYAHAESALKVCIVGGYNNYLRKYSRQEMIDAFGRFKQLLEEWDCMNRPRNSSNVVVSTLIMCPAMVMMRGEPIDRSKEFYNEEGM